jgi:hypothetical protein
MSTLTIRIPETKHARLRLLAQNQGLSMNKLMDELATVALTQHDAETRFRALAAKGSVKRGLELLDKLDRRFRRRKTPGRSWGPGMPGPYRKSGSNSAAGQPKSRDAESFSCSARSRRSIRRYSGMVAATAVQVCR